MTKEKKDKSKVKRGKVYLVPASIAPDSEFIFESDKEIVKTLKYFIVEDDRTARRNLTTMGIKVQDLNFEIYKKGTDKGVALRYMSVLESGYDVGVMSEAGIPSVADPAFGFIDLVQQNNFEVIPMVGPSSIMLALSASGLNGQRFAFNGYISKNPEQRKKEIAFFEKTSQKYKQTQIFIEAPYRNLHFWQDLLEVLRESTKVSIAIDIFGEDQYIKTKKVGQWKKAKWPEFNKKPTIFMFEV